MSVASTEPRLILASQSGSRRAMLSAAGVDFTAIPAHLDERRLEAELAAEAPEEVALALAAAKAEAVSTEHPADLVLGSDSLVVAGGRRFDKPASREEAAEHLRWFSGKEMELHSAAALARGGAVVWRHGALARLRVRALDEGFIARYLDAEWPEVGACVGVFRIEGRGVHLFESIAGDHFTVLGMPLLPVLGALREFGL
jgi:septum formation protein